MGRRHKAFLVHLTFTFLGFLSENVTLKSLLEGDLVGAGDFKPFFGTRIGSNLWHFNAFCNATLLADPHRRITYGAVWAICRFPLMPLWGIKRECKIREKY